MQRIQALNRCIVVITTVIIATFLTQMTTKPSGCEAAHTASAVFVGSYVAVVRRPELLQLSLSP